jgi:phospholipid/cholesterol/gamma-HCH transport system permease protein
LFDSWRCYDAPALTIFGNYIGFVGGWSICHFALDMNTNAFILRLVGSAHPIDLYAGIVKRFVFAWLIATIASQAGLEVTGGAEGVGQSTTSSVVVSIIAMLVANAVLTAIFFFAAPN